jgi:hypothetical protein
MFHGKESVLQGARRLALGMIRVVFCSHQIQVRSGKLDGELLPLEVAVDSVLLGT